MKTIFLVIIGIGFQVTQAQTNSWTGIVEDSLTHEKLVGASITLYGRNGVLGTVTNREGRFLIKSPVSADSLKVSMIGYHSRNLKSGSLVNNSFLNLRLAPEAAMLQEVVVHPMDALEMVKQASRKLGMMIPGSDFESNAFYREIIRDSNQYYSVAEAVFGIQFNPGKKSYKIKLDKGRSKEDVAYTRLFEDFHPGGGPEDAVGQSPVVNIPDFLKGSKLDNYVFKKDSTIRRDDHVIAVIGFDQKPSIHEALEKGKLYIDADDFSLLQFDATNSPLGTPYIKSLRGTDKVFAEILHIDFQNKGWSRAASFTTIDNHLYLTHATLTYAIGYKQPKKNLDLDLVISTELLVTDLNRPITKPINKGEEWKRKDLVANLPTDFDSTFWGNSNILSPTQEINEIIAGLSKKNNDIVETATPDGWQFFNKPFFVSYQNKDSISLVSIAKCNWEDAETGGMLYKMMVGNFSIEARLDITKRSNPAMPPDNGFQQCGLIIRNGAGNSEDYLIASMGTGGSNTPKYFTRRTIAGKSKSQVDKTEHLSGWIKLERKNKTITVYKRSDENTDWIKVDDYQFDWLQKEVQAAFSVMAKFAGDGPKQKPDMKAVFSNIKITQL